MAGLSIPGCSGLPLVAALLLAGCGTKDNAEPEDGGWPLERATVSAEQENYMMHDPCFRKEHGRWHNSEGHCLAMMPQQVMRGVWVRAFEVTDFVPGVSTLAETEDARRPRHWLEIDDARVERFTGPMRGGPHGVGYELTFVGRRSRDPIDVDCQGKATFHVIIDRVLAARFLGPLPPSRHVETIQETIARLRAQPVTVTVKHSGVWGKREADALVRCRHTEGRELGPSDDPPDNISAAAAEMLRDRPQGEPRSTRR